MKKFLSTPSLPRAANVARRASAGSSLNLPKNVEANVARRASTGSVRTFEFDDPRSVQNTAQALRKALDQRASSSSSKPRESLQTKARKMLNQMKPVKGRPKGLNVSKESMTSVAKPPPKKLKRKTPARKTAKEPKGKEPVREPARLNDIIRGPTNKPARLTGIITRMTNKAKPKARKDSVKTIQEQATYVPPPMADNVDWSKFAQPARMNDIPRDQPARLNDIIRERGRFDVSKAGPNRDNLLMQGSTSSAGNLNPGQVSAQGFRNNMPLPIPAGRMRSIPQAPVEPPRPIPQPKENIAAMPMRDNGRRNAISSPRFPPPQPRPQPPQPRKRPFADIADNIQAGTARVTESLRGGMAKMNETLRQVGDTAGQSLRRAGDAATRTSEVAQNKMNEIRRRGAQTLNRGRNAMAFGMARLAKRPRTLTQAPPSRPTTADAGAQTEVTDSQRLADAGFREQQQSARASTSSAGGPKGFSYAKGGDQKTVAEIREGTRGATLVDQVEGGLRRGGQFVGEATQFTRRVNEFADEVGNLGQNVYKVRDKWTRPKNAGVLAAGIGMPGAMVYSTAATAGSQDVMMENADRQRQSEAENSRRETLERLLSGLRRELEKYDITSKDPTILKRIGELNSLISQYQGMLNNLL